MQQAPLAAFAAIIGLAAGSGDQIETEPQRHAVRLTASGTIGRSRPGVLATRWKVVTGGSARVIAGW